MTDIPDHLSMDVQATFWNKMVRDTGQRIYDLKIELETAQSELDLYTEIQQSVQGYRTGLIHYRARLENEETATND